MSDLKTISDLHRMMWYRFLKVVFLLILGFSILFTIFLLVSLRFESALEILATEMFFIIGLYIIRGSFYYVVLNRFRPDK